MKGTITRVNKHGLCEVKVKVPGGHRRTSFTMDRLAGYRGQPEKKFGIREGARVELVEDSEGRVESAQLLSAGAHS